MTAREPRPQMPPGGGCPWCNNLGCEHCQDKPPSLREALERCARSCHLSNHSTQIDFEACGFAVCEAARAVLAPAPEQRFGYESIGAVYGGPCAHCGEPMSTHYCAERRP